MRGVAEIETLVPPARRSVIRARHHGLCHERRERSTRRTFSRHGRRHRGFEIHRDNGGQHAVAYRDFEFAAITPLDFSRHDQNELALAARLRAQGRAHDHRLTVLEHNPPSLRFNHQRAVRSGPHDQHLGPEQPKHPDPNNRRQG